MSTRIHTGFIIQGNIHNALAVIRRVRPRYEALARVVRRTFFSRFTDKNEAFKKWHELRRLARSEAGLSAVDTQMQAVLFPMRGFVLGILYCEQRAWQRSFMRCKGVREFGYWNNTDAPDGMSNSEWAKRGRLWDKALGDTSVPAMDGLAIDITDPNGPY